MTRTKLLLTMILWTILGALACRPIYDTTGQRPPLQLLGHVAGSALTVTVQDKYAYLGFSYELVVLDIADPTNPRWVTALPLPTNEMALAGGYAYIVGRNGFTVVDLHNPAQPLILGQLPSAETAAGVALVGTDAYFIEGRHLHQVDSSDPARPRLLRTLTITCGPLRRLPMSCVPTTM